MKESKAAGSTGLAVESAESRLVCHSSSLYVPQNQTSVPQNQTLSKINAVQNKRCPKSNIELLTSYWTVLTANADAWIYLILLAPVVEPVVVILSERLHVFSVQLALLAVPELLLLFLLLLLALRLLLWPVVFRLTC